MNESQLLGFLTSYVPRLTILRLATNSHLEKPYGDRLSVALLFADISGFTPLTKKFAQQGAEGAEELTRLLNDYFGQLVTLITNHNGDVVRFAGDALLACWVASPETLSTATLQAVHCAHAVQQALNNYQATSDCQLSLKVSIAAGNATALHVGGVEKRWLFCLGGEAVLSIQDGDRQNLPGNIVLSPKAWALVQPYVTTQPLEQGYVTLQSLHSAPSARCLSKPTLPNPSIPYLKAYISRAIHKRIEAGQINWLAEFRHVTILFIKIMGLDYDSADSVEQMQTMVYPLQSILYRYEGNIVSLGVDDKGTTLLAAFGLPAFSHEDDAIRGVSVALEIQKHLQENLLTSAIGITTGQVFCGPIGNDIRREYTVMGDVVNLAARLMQSAAPNTILCSVATKQATERRIEFDALPPQFLKGFGKNIASFAPRQTIRARQDIKKTSTMMVGRQQEKEILRQGLQRFQEQESSIFIVEGEAGIGKSTLADYFLEQAEALGWMCLTGAGDAIEKSAPYYAWRSVLRQLFQQVLPNGTDRIDGLALDEQQRLLHFLQSSPETADLAPLLNPIFPLNLPDTATTAVLSGDSRADKTREFCVRLLQMHLNQSRAVLVIEDAQWLDTASWTLLGQVSQRVKPLCLVVITRPLSEPLPPEYSQLLAAPSTQYLELNSLTTKDTLALVCQRLGVNELPNPVADLILSKAQGHPFFSEELAYALRDAGVFTIATEQCRLNPLMKDLSFLNLPDTIEGTITSRIDRLTPAQQLMVKVASVIGRTFASRMLRDVYPVDADKDHLLEHLEVLNKLNITLLDSPLPEMTYIFKHILIQEVTYNLMLQTQRRQLHHAIGKWYETLYGENLPQFYPLLAHHWSKAVDDRTCDPVLLRKAIAYRQKAAEQAMYNSANIEAVDHLQQGLKLIALLPDPQEQIQQELAFQTSLGYALMSMRGYGDPDVERAYVRANELGKAVEKSPQIVPLLYGLLSFYSSRAKYSNALHLADQILGVGYRFNDPIVQLVGHNAKGLSSVLQGNLLTGKDHTQKSYLLADAHEEASALVQYGGNFRGYPRVWLAIAQCLLGYPDQALQTVERAIALTQEQPYTLAFILCFAPIAQLRQDVQKTLDAATQLLHISQRYGFMMLGTIANIYRGWALTQLHRTPEGVALIEQSLPIPQFIKLDSLMPWYLGLYAEAQSQVGALDAALATLDQSIAYVKTAQGNLYEAELHRLRGEVLRKRGEPIEQVEASLRRAIALAKQQGAKWWELRAAISLYQLHCQHDSAVPERQALQNLCHSFTEGFETIDFQTAKLLLAG